MAILATHQWRNIIGGAETNGGGFDPTLTAGMLTDGACTLATSTSPVFTSASYSFVAGDVGSYLYIAAGTNWTAGWYPIVSVSGGAATLDASINSLRGGALLANNLVLSVSGCATVASPTGATFTIDYSGVATAPLSLTDLACSASTSTTSATAGFTPVMVGNTLRLASGTASGGGVSTGYYAITGYTNSSTIVLDRPSGTGYISGVGVIGGAHASIVNYISSATGLATPLLPTPVIAGNIIKIKGSGTENPTTVDYNYSAGYATFTTATISAGITVMGYNGRSLLSYEGLLFYNASYYTFKDLCFIQVSAGFTTYGVSTGQGASAFRCSFDQGGFDATQWSGLFAMNCAFMNSGSVSAGTKYAVASQQYMTTVYGCVFENMKGGAYTDNGSFGSFVNNIVRGCRGTTIAAIGLNNAQVTGLYTGNTIDRGAGDGIVISTTNQIGSARIFNNIISNHLTAGKYAIKLTIGTTYQNDMSIAGKYDYNNLYNNTASRNLHSAGEHDLAVDPQYTNPMKVGTVTMTIATPAVITLTSHGLSAGDKVSFATTGALPTGITAGNQYFVISSGLTANTFQIAATAGGAAINTSGTQSGVHTMTYATGSMDYSVGTNMKAVGFPSVYPI